MSSSGKSKKKEKPFVECPDCSKTIASRDAERHKAECGSEESPKVPYLTGEKLVVLTTPCQREHVPQDCFGWNAQICALVHPDVLQQIGATSRTPCLLRTLPERQLVGVVALWPSTELAPLRVSIPGQPNERLVELEVVADEKQKTVDSVLLGPAAEKVPPFYGLRSFADLLRVYFANSFLLPGTPMQCRYLGNLCELEVQGHCHENEAIVLRTTAKTRVALKSEISVKSKKPLDLDSLGGCEEAKAEIRTSLLDPIKENTTPSSVILWGITGTGKTLLLDILKHSVAATSELSLTDPLFEQYLSHLMTSKTLVLIDNYNAEAASKHMEAICQFLDNGNTLVLAARDIEAVELPLRRRIATEVELSVPSQAGRIEILKMLLKQESLEEEVNEEQMKDIAMQTHGYTGSDLKAALKDASRKKGGSFFDRLLTATRKIRPTGLRQFILEVPNVRWEEIGGYDKLKKEIQQAVVLPQQDPEAFEQFGLQPPRGILLYGPPGCSKTLVARALASQSKLNFLAVKGPELFSKWVGESEKAVRDIFRRARQVAPSILFFDEIDAIGVARGSDQGGNRVGDRVLTQLLTELDGLEKSSGVIVLAATNRPDAMDSALLRPGRFDKAIYVPLPDIEARKSIISMQLERMKVHPDVKVSELAARTEGYSGAEVVAMCKTAAMIALQEDVRPEHEDVRPEHVTRANFDASLHQIVARTDKKALEGYRLFKRGEQPREED
uniref:AAA domain-containing protein n=1 Tax=Steinernema glaseri TaxID=37863 RepID=A0A1I8AWD8_9BILA